MFFAEGGNGSGAANLESLSLFTLSPVQRKILNHLKENGPAALREIQDALGLKQQTVSYSIKRLVERGLVKGSGEARNARFSAVEGARDEKGVKSPD